MPEEIYPPRANGLLHRERGWYQYRSVETQFLALSKTGLVARPKSGETGSFLSE